MSDFLGMDELMAAFDALVRKAAEADILIVKRAEAVVEKNIKKQFKQAHSKKTPTPSPAGSPPAVISGNLRRGITSDPVSMEGLTAVGRVYPTAVYARIQELGGDRIPARPYVQPGYDASKAEIEKIAVVEWAKATR